MNEVMFPTCDIVVCKDEVEWLQERQKGIGASDAAAVLGANPFRSSLEVYLNKITPLEEQEREDSDSMFFGKESEPMVAKRYIKKTGRKLLDLGDYTILQSVVNPIFTATLDRVIEPSNGNGAGILEIKTAGHRMADRWEEEPPDYYQVQLQHQLLVTGLQWGSLAVLIGGQEFKWFDIPRHEGIISLLREKLVEFWECVKTMTPPPPDGSDSAKRALAKLYPRDIGPAVALPIDAMSWDAELQEVKEEIKGREEHKSALENRIKAAIGDAAYGILPDNSAKYSWKVQEKK